MLTLNEKNYCSLCFSELEEKSTKCSVCDGKTNTERYVVALPEDRVLAGRYAVGRVLGKGGFGITYLCYDFASDKRVAIKEFFPSNIAHRNAGETNVFSQSSKGDSDFAQGAKKFADEAGLLSEFNGNSNIINVDCRFSENGTEYFVMEYLDGCDLGNYIKRQPKRSLGEREAIRIVKSVAAALVTVHNKGVLHRDISPENIYICRDGNVKLIDFGAARYYVGDASNSLSLILRPEYAPLEQYTSRGNQGPWTDIYALGATMYHMLTGRYLPDAASRLGNEKVSTDGITPALAAVIEKMVALNIESRYKSAEELLKALERVEGAVITPPPRRISSAARVIAACCFITAFVAVAAVTAVMIAVRGNVDDSDVNPPRLAYSVLLDVGERAEISNSGGSIEYWTSSDESIATVDENGVVYAHSAGEVTITAYGKNGKKDTCLIRVSKKEETVQHKTTQETQTQGSLPQDNGGTVGNIVNEVTPTISISKTSLELYINSEEILWATVRPSGTNAAVIWKSDNTNVAEVDNSGRVKAKAEGKATITATLHGRDLSASCVVTVRRALVGEIKLESTALELYKGDSTVLSATVSPDNATDKTLKWTSKNPAVAEVDGNGRVTARAVGEAIIRVSSSDGNAYAECKVTVKKTPVKEIKLDRTALELYKGDSTVLSATVSPDNATDKTVKWTSDNTAVADVDKDGRVTARSAGEAIIRVSSSDGNAYAECRVTVREAPLAHGKQGSITWELYESGRLLVSGTRGATFRHDSSLDPYKENVVFLETTGGVNIGDMAFREYPALREIKTNASKIGKEAFYGCTSLVSMDASQAYIIDIGISAFAECTGLETVRLQNVQQIQMRGFENCRSIRTFEFGSLAALNNYALAGCTGIKEITIDEAVDLYGYCFYGWTQDQTILLNGYLISNKDPIRPKEWYAGTTNARIVRPQG